MDKSEEPVGDEMVTAENSLVRFENPILTRDSKGPVQRRVMKSTAVIQTSSPGFPQTAKIPGLVGASTGSQDTSLSKQEMADILQVIFPTREWVEGDDKVWQQKISTVPAVRQDVLHLAETLDMRLRQQQVTTDGICPIRHHLYSQAFDELIREIAIDSAERGLLLLRIREEIRMTVAAYEALYKDSVEYGEKKAMLVQEDIQEMLQQIETLEHAKKQSEATLQSIKIKIDLTDREHVEKKKAFDKRHADEVSMLKRSNQQLKMLLDTVNAFAKKL